MKNDIFQPQSILLASIDDLLIYSTHIQVANRRKEFSEVVKVDGGIVSISINLVPSVKHSWVSVSFDNGDSYYMDEDRTIFGRDRHRRIAECSNELKKSTFKFRMNRLNQELIKTGSVKIGDEVDETYTLLGAVKDLISKPKPKSIFLSKDGIVTNGDLALDLGRCRRDGVLELGINRTNKQASGQVYACYERSMIEKSNKKALKFSVSGDFDQDTVMAMLNWFATSN